MPSLKCLPDVFSLQGCAVAEGVVVPRKRRVKRSGDAFGTPLFSQRGSPDAPSGRAGVPREGDRLSIGHNDTILPSKPTPPTFRMWKGASLAEVPGIPNHGPCRTNQLRAVGKRGKVLSFSEASRRNLQVALAKVRTDAELYTFCLSACGYVEHLTHASVKSAFLQFMKRLTAKSSRDPRFRTASGLWKQEIQGRRVLHFHVVLAGVLPVDLAHVHAWICAQWIDCIMAVPGMPSDLQAEEIRKMRCVHLFEGKGGLLDRKSALQKIVGNFQAYFAKYLGKDEKNIAANDIIPGRWWGRFNGAHLPTGKLCELVLPPRVNVHAQRIARKIRQKRANAAKHRAVCQQWGFVTGEAQTEPTLSEFGLLGKRGRIFRHIVDSGEYTPAEFEKWGGKVPKFGPYRFAAPMKFSTVRLTGAHVPDMMVRVLQYAGARALVDRERTPF